MKFSIITPMLNGIPKIRQCIGSVRAQVSEDVAVEHIIKDGGSTDSSIQYLSDFSGRLEKNTVGGYRLKWIGGKDQGMYDAINMGWRESTGDILSWLNTDEQYLPGCLSLIQRVFERDPSVDFVFGDYIIVTGAGQPISVRRTVPIRRFYLKHDYLYAASCTLFFRKRLFDEGLLAFDTAYKNAGDLDLILKLADHGRKSVHIPEILSLFTADGKNLSVVNEAMMAEEVGRIHSRYGHTHRLMKAGVKILRTAEKAIRGCYRKNDISYLYAVDDAPDYQRIESANVPFLFSFKRIR